MDASAWMQRSIDFGNRSGAGSWVALDAIGQPAPYVKIHDFDGDIINAYHHGLLEAPLGRLGVPILIDIGIDGFLHRAEALKLYEMAYFSSGSIIELGTHKGLSTAIMARATLDRCAGVEIETVDIDKKANKVARSNVTQAAGGASVTFTISDATKRLDQIIAAKRKAGFIFIDHWHGYKETLEAAERARHILAPGGYVMFHDFLDPGNNTPDHPYGVYAAVLDAYDAAPEMQFVQLCGSSAIFSRVI